MPRFDTENPGQWFYFDPDNPETGGLRLRIATPKEVQRIDRLTVKHNWKFERGTGRRYDDQKEDEKLAHALRVDYSITNWKEVYLDNDDTPAECTRANKVRAMESPDFMKFYLESMEELNRTNVALDEARAKNLESSSSGSAEEQSTEPVTSA